MKYSEAFMDQWDSLTNYLVSKMLTSTDQTNAINIQDLERALSNEIRKWSIPGHYNQIWLENLRAEDDRVAQSFFSELSNFKLHAVNPSEIATPWIWKGGFTAGGAAIGFALTKLLSASAALVSIATVGLGIVGIAAGSGVVKQKGHDAAAAVGDEYKRQLQAEGEKLLTIVKQADR